MDVHLHETDNDGMWVAFAHDVFGSFRFASMVHDSRRRSSFFSFEALTAKLAPDCLLPSDFSARSTTQYDIIHRS